MNIENLFIHTKAAIDFEGKGQPGEHAFSEAWGEHLEYDEATREFGDIGILLYTRLMDKGELQTLCAKVADRLIGWEGDCIKSYDRENISFTVNDGETWAVVTFAPWGRAVGFSVTIERLFAE